MSTGQTLDQKFSQANDSGNQKPQDEQGNNDQKPLEKPESYTSFDDMGLDDLLLRGIYAKGWDNPTYIQKLAVVPMARGKDTLAQAESGMGKSGAFLIGTLARIQKPTSGRATQAVILSPTRELAQQTQAVCKDLAYYLSETTGGQDGFMLDPYLMVGGTSTRDMRDYLLNNTPEVIIATPGRLKHMIEDGMLDLSQVQTMVLDECDELLSRGFKEAIYEIFQFLDPSCQIGCFSATMPPEVVTLTKKFLRKDHAEVLKPAQDLILDGIKQFWVDIGDTAKVDVLRDLFETLTISQSMIFINSKEEIDRIADQLRQNDHMVGVIHSGLDPMQRGEQMKRFKGGLDRVLLCSDLMGRGIDIQGVSVVVNYDMPVTGRDGWKANYLHRIGRSGRFGKKGVSINFIGTRDDAFIQSELEKHYNHTIDEMPVNVDDFLK